MRKLSLFFILLIVTTFTLSAAKRTVFFKNTGNWSDVAVWIWDDSNNYTGGTWPGAKVVSGGTAIAKPTTATSNYNDVLADASCEKVDINGTQYFKIEINIKKSSDPLIIFSNNGGGSQSGDGVKMVAGGIYNSSVSSTPTGDNVLSGYPDVPTEESDNGLGEYTQQIKDDNRNFPADKVSGKLPVIYINVYENDTINHKGELNYQLVDKDYLLKDYHKVATYYMTVPDGYTLDINGTAATAIASKEKPDSLEIKLRGNYTRSGFSKKPYKLKLKSKTSMLGMTKSKHFALIAHADDDRGFMRNFVGFTLGKLIGLPWTPAQQPVEVVINGQYRGLYFLTESIRVEKDRINITELEDNVTDNTLISGGYLVELDNYEKDALIKINEKPRVNTGNTQIWITPDTPEEYSDIQKRFVEEQFNAMNDQMPNIIGNHDLWRYMDLDDAVRYYLVRELIDDYESYHGSCYLFRNYGEGEKWHFSPLWDHGSAFRRSNCETFIYNAQESYGNTWIHTMVKDSKFDAKLKDSWKWFMTTGYKELSERMKFYANQISVAAWNDHDRWSGAATPVGGIDPVNGNNIDATTVRTNPEIGNKLSEVIGMLDRKINWLKGQWGQLDGTYTEPERDTTAAMPLPDYAKPAGGDTPEPGPDTTKRLYLVDKSNWGVNNTAIRAYIYNSDSDVYQTWPGTAMKYDATISYKAGTIEGTGAYVLDIPSGYENGYVIFYASDSNRYPANNQPSMKLDGKSVLFFTDETSLRTEFTIGNGGDTPEPEPEPNPGKYYIYFDNTSNFSAPYVHAWNGGGNCTAAGLAPGASNNGWPGDKMTKLDNGLWYWEAPANATQPTQIIISDDGGTKAGGGDLTFKNGATYKGDGTSTGGEDPVESEWPATMVSGTLPVIYITVRNEDGSLNGDMLNKDYLLKEYHSNASYYMTVPQDYKLEKGGQIAEAVGSEDAQLPLEIKLRGNYTRSGFSKKPYKLKLGAKTALLGLTKSKHFALIAHADDDRGFMRNFVGFTLGKLIGLPWTPAQQPVEVVINGQYRGLYFLTESIRVDKDRINIKELADEETDNTLISGGYLVELDNYAQDAAFSLDEVNPNQPGAKVNVTPDTPEVYSAIQERFIKEQFTAMNNSMGNIAGSELWKYIDVYDAARYYLVKELIDDYESYHGSCYLFRDYGEGEKWHFSPLWDCGSAFRRDMVEQYLYENRSGIEHYGNTWIPNMAKDVTFNNKLKEFWRWFMSTGYNELDEKMSFYADQIRVAAEVDDKRWKNAPLPNGGVDPVNGNAINATAVKTNPDIDAKLKEVKSLLERKINWLKGQWGSFEGTYNQPVRDDEDNYMPLPDYASPDYDPSKLTRLYVADEANWSSNGSKEIYAYIYKDGAGDMAAWKGTKMTYDANLVYKGSDGTNKQGLYYVVIEEKYADGLAIVTNSDESKRYPAANQAGMKLEGVSKLYYTGKVSLSSAESVGYPWSGTLPVIKIATAAEVTKDKQTATEWSVISTKGIESVSPIALEIKGRGSSTWTDFDKKPYKLKFADKVALAGLTKSKHFVLLPYAADAANGLLVNSLGHKISNLLGMDWTPAETPVEVVINGDYKGLYFVVENVRPSKNRVAVGDYGDFGDSTADIVYDMENDWLIEIDNTAVEDDVIYSHSGHKIVPSNPDFSDVKKYDKENPGAGHTNILKGHLENHVNQLFEAAEYAAAHPMSENWREVFDTDQAIKYFVIQELMDDSEAYNTAFFMHHTTGEKWKLGPVWDFTGSFASYKNGGEGKASVRHGYNLYDYTKSGLTAPAERPVSAIVSKLYANHWFRDDVIRLFTAFTTATSSNEDMATPMSAYDSSATIKGGYSEIENHIANLGSNLQAAAEADAKRWPQYAATSADSDVAGRANKIIRQLDANKEYLAKVWNFNTSGVENVTVGDEDNGPAEYYDLMGRRVINPIAGSIYIVRRGTTVTKELYR